MNRLKVLFVGIFFLFSLSLAEKDSSDSIDFDNLSSKEAETLLLILQPLITAGYESNKLEVISKIVSEFSEDPEPGNITLVGSQNVYSEDGTIKEIRTIELVIPKLQRKSVIGFSPENNEDTEFDDEDLDKMRGIKEAIEALSLLGLNIEMFYIDYNRKGEIEQEFYFDKDTIFAKYQGINFLNKTIEVANKQIVEDYLKDLKEGPIPVSRLNFDKDGNFLENGSTAVSELLASVISDYGEPSPEIIKTALEGVAKVSLESRSKSEVPEKLQAYLKEKIPDTVFFVTSGEPVGDYINKNYSLHVTYDLVEFDDYVSYSIFGH